MGTFNDAERLGLFDDSDETSMSEESSASDSFNALVIKKILYVVRHVCY